MKRSKAPEGMVTIHAGCVIIGEAGILIRGESGAGKSSLARMLLARAETEGRFSRLVSDDRTRLTVAHGRLIARPVPAIAGLIEIRGIGIVSMPHEPSAIVRLIVDLAEMHTIPRLPEAGKTAECLCGIMIPRFFVSSGVDVSTSVLDGLRCFGLA